MQSRKVLLYSGGMDSVAARVLWKPDVLLYVNTGNEYGWAERRKLPPECELAECKVPCAKEYGEGIVPARNLVLVAVASQWGRRVGLAATAGDRVKDKDETFAERAGGVLSHIWDDYWNAERPYTVAVELPVKHLTKRQLLAECAAHGVDLDKMARESLSCYTPKKAGGECGHCKACFRKWVAFRLHGVKLPYDAEPYIRTMILPMIRLGKYGRGEEEQDILEALGETYDGQVPV